MKKIQISITYVWWMPVDGWSMYTVQNDQHGGLLAVVDITDEYAKALEATHLPMDIAVETLAQIAGHNSEC